MNDEHKLITCETALMSRRCFLSGAATVGALSFLGAAFGGRIEAYADEAGNKSYVLYVISSKEIVVQAVQPAGEDSTVVPGVNVIIESLYNGVTVTGETDVTGTAMFDIHTLAMQYDPNSTDLEPSKWSFWGKVSVSKEGYREFVNPQVFIEGGPAPADEATGVRGPNIQVPAQPLDRYDGIYLRTAAFNGYDVQYTPNTFYVEPSNENIDTLEVEVCVSLDPSAQIAVAFCVDNGGDGKFKTLASDSIKASKGVASFKFQGQWLKTIKGGSRACIDFMMKTTAPLRAYLQLEFVEYLDIVGANSMESSQETYSITDSCAGDGVCELDSLLFGTNHSFNLAIPGSPVTIVNLPSGYVGLMVDVGSSTKTWDSKEKSFAPWKAKSMADSFGESWFNDMEKTYGEKFDKTVDLYDQGATPWEGLKKNWAFGASFKFAFQVLGLAKYHYLPDDEKRGEGELRLTGKMSASVEISFTTRFLVGPVPMFIEIKGLGLFAPSFNGIWNFNRKCLKPTDSPRASSFDFVLDFRFDLGLSIGAGIPGLLSAGVRGYGIVEYELHFLFSTDETKSLPRRIFKWAAGAEIFWQALIFSGSYTIKEKPLLPAAKDSWNTALASSHLSTANETSRMIGEDELAGVAEFTAVWNNAVLLGTGNTVAGLTYNLNSKASASYTDTPQFSTSGGDIFTGELDYNPLQGIKPSNKYPVFGDTFADTRPKIVTLPNGGKWVFRLAVVNISADTSVFDVLKSKPATLLTSEGKVSATSKSYFLNPKGGSEAQVFATPYPVAVSDNSVLSENAAGNERFAASSSNLTAASNVNSISRVRLVAQQYLLDTHSYSEPEVIDFYTGYATVPEDLHLNHHDVDFGVCCGNNNKFYLGITSIIRPTSDEGESFDEQAQRMYTTMICFDPSCDKGSDERLQCVTSLYDQYRNKGLCSWNPVLASIPVVDASGKDDPHIVLAVATMDSRSEEAPRPRIWMHSVNEYWNNYKNPVYSGYLSYPGGWEPTEVSNIRGKLNLTVCHADKPTLMLSWTEECLYGSEMKLSSSYFITDIDGNVRTADGTASRGYWHVYCGTEPISTYMGQAVTSKWEDYPCFMYAIEEIEQPVNGVQPADCGLIKTLRRVLADGPTSFSDIEIAITNSARFYVGPDGKSLYSLRLFNASADKLWGENGNAGLNDELNVAAGAKRFETISYGSVGELKEGEGAEQYQIMRGHYNAHTNRFLDFYPIAQLEDAPDFFAVIKDNETGGEFLQATVDTSTLEEGGSPKSNYYHLSVPTVVGVQLEEATLENCYVGPGDTCRFSITVSNVGNVRLKSFNVRIAVYAGSDTTASDNIRLNIDTSIQEPANKSQFLNKDGILDSDWQRQEMPMKPKRTLLYRTGFVVPEEWSDGQPRTLEITVSDPIPATDEIVMGGEDTIRLLCDDPRKTDALTVAVVDRGAPVETTMNTVGYGTGDEHDIKWDDDLPALRKIATIAATKGKKKRTATLKWGTTYGKKCKCTGYQIYIRRNIKGAKAKYYKVVGSSISSKVFKKLKAGGTYIFKVRMYRKANGKTTYGPWSKSVKAKAAK